MAASFDARELSAQSIVVRQTCTNCGVSVSASGRLSLEGFARIGNPLAIARDRAGRYLVAAGGPILKVFSQDGTLLREMDRPQGATEGFGWIRNVFVGPSGNIHVVDQSSRRQVVLTPSLVATKVDTIVGRLMGSPIADVKDRSIMNMYVPSPDLAPHVVHLVDGKAILRSFGTAGDEVLRLDLESTVERRLAYESDSTFWVARVNEYRIGRWTAGGRHIHDLVREPKLFAPWTEDLGPSMSTPPVSKIRAMQVDAERDELWVLVQVPDARWKSTVQIVTTSEGSFYVPKSYNEYWDTIVEVIDLNKRLVVASQRLDPLLLGFADNRLSYSLDASDPSRPVATLWSLSAPKP